MRFGFTFLQNHQQVVVSAAAVSVSDSPPNSTFNILSLLLLIGVVLFRARVSIPSGEPVETV